MDLFSKNEHIMIFTIFVRKTNKKQYMHFVLSYDLGATGEKRREIEQRIESILNPYRHIKRLSTFYIIHIQSNAEWETIRTALTSLSREIVERFHFIMSPAISEGAYNGILPKGEWDEINAITNS